MQEYHATHVTCESRVLARDRRERESPGRRIGLIISFAWDWKEVTGLSAAWRVKEIPGGYFFSLEEGCEVAEGKECMWGVPNN